MKNTTKTESVVSVGYCAAGQDVKIRFDNGDWIPMIIKYQLASGAIVNATLQGRLPGIAK